VDNPTPAQWLGLAVALGAGLLVGLERERRKGRGSTRAPAGIRSFALTALGGALAQTLGQPGLAIAGALLVAALAAVSHWKSQSRDPGLTTELALFTTYLVGIQAVVSPLLGAACGVALAVLLAARTRLHRFATQMLSEQELHDALLLAALTLIVLPLAPSEPLTWLGGLNPRSLVGMVVLLLLLQAAGHVALRLLGPGLGVAASGFFSGFASSTATVAALGSQARRHAAWTGLLATGAVLSTAATWVQVMFVAAALSPNAAQALAPVAAAGVISGLACGGVMLLRARNALGAGTRPMPLASRPVLGVREAALIALLLSIVTLLVAWAQTRFGQAGLVTGIALASLADAHAPAASLAARFGAGQLLRADLVLGVLVAVTANSATRCVTAWIAGGPRFAWRVVAALLLQLAAAWLAWGWVG
jgi:uncharacterized membrane protein (DUF4010 family)